MLITKTGECNGTLQGYAHQIELKENSYTLYWTIIENMIDVGIEVQNLPAGMM